MDRISSPEDTNVIEGEINSSLCFVGGSKENSIIPSGDIDSKEDQYIQISHSLEHAQDLHQSLEHASNGGGLYLNQGQ